MRGAEGASEDGTRAARKASELEGRIADAERQQAAAVERAERAEAASSAALEAAETAENDAASLRARLVTADAELVADSPRRSRETEKIQLLENELERASAEADALLSERTALRAREGLPEKKTRSITLPAPCRSTYLWRRPPTPTSEPPTLKLSS